MLYHAMMFFWALSEKHKLLKPFELIGNFLEDYGLDNGYIKLKDEIVEEIKQVREEFS